MIKLIINIIILAVLAVFVAMNVSYTTTINLFGTVFEGISVVAVILLSMVGGVIYSFLYYVMDYLTRNSKSRIKKKRLQNKEKEKELKSRESSMENSKHMVQEQSGSPDAKTKLSRPKLSAPDTYAAAPGAAPAAVTAAGFSASGNASTVKKKKPLFRKRSKTTESPLNESDE